MSENRQKIILRLFITLFFVAMLMMTGVSVFLAYTNYLLVQRLPERTNENVLTEDTSNITQDIANETITSNNTVITETFWSLEAVTPTPVVMYELKPKALILWGLYMQEKYNSTANPTTNAKVMSMFDIPNDVSCLVGSESYYYYWYWFPGLSRWRIECRTNDFSDFTAFVVNGTAARGITGGIYYDTMNPFLVYGMGRWPEISYESITTFPSTIISASTQEPNETPTPQETNLP